MYTQLPIKKETYTSYSDVTNEDPELTEALKRLQRHGIMKGNGIRFFPHDFLKGEELLALLGRVFFNLQDSPEGDRWTPYFQTFIDELLIASQWGYIRQSIPRKEVFLLLWKMLQR